MKVKKRHLTEDATRHAENGALAVVVEGNGIEWEPDAWIWMPPSVAYELDEANALTMLPESDRQVRSLGEWTVYVYELTN